MVIPIEDTTFPITTRTTTTGSVRHIGQTVTKRATKTITTIISAEVTTLLTDIVTATVSIKLIANLPLVLREVYCKVAGYPDSQYFLNATIIESIDEPIFTACKAYCLSIPGAVSFSFNPAVCGCFSGGAHTIDTVNPDRSYNTYDMAYDMAEKPSLKRARSRVVTAGPHLVKRDDDVPMPAWLPGPRDPATISAECLCLFTRPRNAVLSTIPITEVDTITVTGVDPGSVPDAVTSTVTVTDATIQTVLSTITATVPAITITAEVTPIWG
ncbi:hypothetical protein FGLOB1_10568 [Fusarium globosum]|uniref:Uncharacterized protein n=1 Tax=Fusarium globosum TaxID=78864 RepID=A0A8H5XWG0_9HYPO|nr:hypothetical protein FGLOB1_10568 [Fusarium globosum]